jgi:hypothetical protein
MGGETEAFEFLEVVYQQRVEKPITRFLARTRLPNSENGALRLRSLPVACLNRGSPLATAGTWV